MVASMRPLSKSFVLVEVNEWIISLYMYPFLLCCCSVRQVAFPLCLPYQIRKGVEIPRIELVVQAARENNTNEVASEHRENDIICRDRRFATPSSSEHANDTPFFLAAPFSTQEAKY